MGGTPKFLVCFMDNPMNMDDLGVPPVRKPLYTCK